ncbi:CYTH and CHAD domain-containing protein [Pseudovibrio exalbescens]|uniref:CYTH and CHAD domain-containing protein n=1 Tax=Pseudovibrio exalbescens TaxID=197461 RepID=UPI0023660E27|nr:CYTH and CHAD domain-containing protein [Pseudovibrio exalbescens]MDD7911787.1 CYTH and CHAD domain-containing protein [Pseudovibrio exalbescens]
MNEVELKLSVSSENLAKALARADCADFSVEDEKTKKLVSIYFDTPDKRLKKASTTLRIRNTGSGLVQTLKVGTGLTRGLSNTREFEVPTENTEPDLALIEDESVRASVAELLNGSEIVARFETRIDRVARDFVRGPATEIEVAFDNGKAVAKSIEQEICEIELELKSGPVEELYILAGQILGDIPFNFSKQSKAEIGHALADCLEADEELSWSIEATTAGKIALGQSETAEDALVSILSSCLTQIAGNRASLIQHANNDRIEFTHQMRVGLRRFRSALKVYESLIGSTALSEMGREAQRLATYLGNLRDLDVMATDIIGPLDDLRPEGIEFTDLLKALDSARDAVREDVIKQLETERANHLILQLARFIQTREWRQSLNTEILEALDMPAREFANYAIQKRWKACAKRAKHLEKLTIEERHDLRKALKKFRYCIEFFKSLYDKEQTAVFIKSLKQLQDVFGYLNDVAMTDRLVAMDLPAAETKHPLLPAIGFVAGWHKARADHAWEDAQDRWKELKETPRFWRD